MSTNSFLWLLVVTFFLCIAARLLYNVYFHPLSKFPGPTLWAMTRLCFVTSLVRGDLHLKIKDFHDRYGTVIRVAPNELSFIEGSAWQDMYTGHNKNKGFPKNAVVFGAQQFRSILDGSEEDHTRMRKILAHAFSNQALNRQEGLLHRYIDILLRKLGDVVESGQSINIVEWYNWLSFDLTGELAFSESFDQLEQKAYHPWVKMIVGHLKYSALSIGLRYYSPLNELMPYITPRHLHRLKWSFVTMSREKVLRRLARPESKTLDDILGACLSPDSGEPMMTMEELIGTFTFLIVAGSETTATVLAGVTNYICRNPKVFQRLKDEVRAIKSEKQITITSTATMPYLNAVIKEGMRMCYPIPGALTRVVPRGGRLVSGHFIPEGTLVGIPQFAAHYCDVNFENPYEFIPERWTQILDDDSRSIFQPFAIGGRNCIGQNLAWAEMRLVLARVVYNFDLEPADDLCWLDQKSYYLWEKEPFLVRVSKRS